MKLTKYIQAEVMSFERFDDFYYQPKNGLPEERRVSSRAWTCAWCPKKPPRGGFARR